MLFQLNYRDSRPIYEQIRDALRRAVISGALKGGEKLPSVRELAAQYSINPNTIQRAYRELELEGYIYTIPGKGCFAIEEPPLDEAKKRELMEKLRAIVGELQFLGVSSEEILRGIRNGGENT